MTKRLLSLLCFSLLGGALSDGAPPSAQSQTPPKSAPAAAGFIVVSSAQREEIEKALAQTSAADSFERDVARARVFTDYRLWYDAIAAFSDLVARFPDRAELYELRGQIYAQAQVTVALSEKDFARADKLAAAKKPQ